ncbi:hypothetical protein [Erythrobacter alti]|uniref:hypothetical protein n=1 Tax=Erythrobacter alti TaxID=1896145 RepID=UPI0030F441AD
MTGRHLIASAALAVLLSACASPQQQRHAQQGRAAERTLDRIGTIGDPGRVAAADIAFARMARDEGQWTAFRAYAASDAVIHGRNGPVPIEVFTANLEDPETSTAWTPNTIWTSCDGTLAVTFGRMQVQSGDVGSYVTVWELQSDRDYKWTYDIGALDDPQPEPEAGPDVPEGEEFILVPGMGSIEGRVADCPRTGAFYGFTRPELSQGTRSGSAQSDDGTMTWQWVQLADGTRAVTVDWWRGGEWQQAAEFVVPPRSD